MSENKDNLAVVEEKDLEEISGGIGFEFLQNQPLGIEQQDADETGISAKGKAR